MLSLCPLLSQVLRTYNVLDMKNTTCQDLQIEVMVMGHVEYTSECWGQGHGASGGWCQGPSLNASARSGSQRGLRGLRGL